MQKSCRVSFMYGELTDKNTIDAIDEALETHQTEQFEILLYKKNRKSIFDNFICSAERFGNIFTLFIILSSNILLCFKATL